jgi:hypothetical protein
MARGMGRVYKGRNNKRIFSKVVRQAKVKNRYIPNPHSDGDRPRENQGLSPPLQNFWNMQTAPGATEFKP